MAVVHDGVFMDDASLLREAEALLDASYQEDGDVVDSLLGKLLDIEEPVISMGSVDFLTSSGVCEKLVDAVCMRGWTGKPRLTAADGPSPELIRAFRATSLLTCGENGYSFGLFMDKCAINIATRILDLFLEDSGGSFYHAEEIVIFLLKTRPSVVHNALTEGGAEAFGARMENIMRFIGHEPVANLTRILLTEPALQPYTSVPDHMAGFLSCLGSWGVIKHLSRIICEPAAHCVITDAFREKEHVQAAIETLVVLLDRLHLTDPSESLSGLGEATELLERLVAIAIDPTYQNRLRQMCLHFFCDLLRGSSFYMHVVYVTDDTNKAPQQKFIENKLHRKYSYFVDAASAQMVTVLSYLMDSPGAKGAAGAEEDAVKHPGSYAVPPFGALRLQLLTFVAAVVEASPAVCENLTAAYWQQLVRWVEQYPHNDIYHSLFYKIFFSVLRRGSDSALDVLFQAPVSLVDWFIDLYVDHGSYVTAKEKGAKNLDETLRRRLRLRGFCMKCTNALRLLLDTLSPDSHTRQLVQGGDEGSASGSGSGSRWNTFLSVLVPDSWEQQVPGAGSSQSSSRMASLAVAEHPEDAANYLAGLVEAGADGRYSDVLLDGVQVPLPACLDHGSFLAKSLGFTEEDSSWTESEQTTALREGRLESFDHDDEQDDDGAAKQ